MSAGTYALTVRVRIFALQSDGRCALDPIAQGSFPCEAAPEDAATAASELAMSSSEGISSPPPRARVEVALWRAAKGAPPALHADCPWHQRAALAREMASRLAVRVLRQPPPKPPMSPLIDAVTGGALEGADAYKDLRDLAQLLKVTGAPDAAAMEKLADLADNDMVKDLLSDPRALALAQAFMEGK